MHMVDRGISSNCNDPQNKCKVISIRYITLLRHYVAVYQTPVVSEMTYYVSSGTLNSTNSTQLSDSSQL